MGTKILKHRVSKQEHSHKKNELNPNKKTNKKRVTTATFITQQLIIKTKKNLIFYREMSLWGIFFHCESKLLYP